MHVMILHLRLLIFQGLHNLPFKVRVIPSKVTISSLLSLLLHPLLLVKSTEVTLRCHSKQRREGIVHN